MKIEKKQLSERFIKNGSTFIDIKQFILRNSDSCNSSFSLSDDEIKFESASNIRNRDQNQNPENRLTSDFAGWVDFD